MNSKLTYAIPTPLVNGLIRAILISLITVAGYMIVWNGQDKAYKATMEARVNAMERRITRLEERERG